MASPVRDALKQAWSSAVHLEMRDCYRVEAETDDFAQWQSGTWTTDKDAARRAGWFDLVRECVGRGVVMRRARVVSVPLSDYIRFEHFGTELNIRAGEQVRWLVRTKASDLALPGNDFWLIDGQAVIFNHFTGDGGWASEPMEIRTEPDVAKLCADAFEAVWSRAMPHDEFQI